MILKYSAPKTSNQQEIYGIFLAHLIKNNVPVRLNEDDAFYKKLAGEITGE